MTKQDTKNLKGLAIIFMVLLHLFCKKTDLPYQIILKIGDIPLVYYIGLFGDQCVAIYCFCSGYAHYIMANNSAQGEYYKNNLFRLFKLLINFWIVVVLFSIIGFLFRKGDIIPGNFAMFLKNFLLYKTTYNGAWWFMLIYCLLVLISPLCYRLVKQHNSIIIFIVALVMYFFAYEQRIKTIFNTDDLVIQWIFTQSALLGTSLLPYIVGMIFYKQKILTKLGDILTKHNIKNWTRYFMVIACWLILIVGHGIIQSMFIAPMIAVVTICCFYILPKGNKTKATFSIFGKHSTNIWLTHMFFYSSSFDGLVFKGKYPIVIFIFTMSLSIIISLVINSMYLPLTKYLNNLDKIAEIKDEINV